MLYKPRLLLSSSLSSNVITDYRHFSLFDLRKMKWALNDDEDYKDDDDEGDDDDLTHLVFHGFVCPSEDNSSLGLIPVSDPHLSTVKNPMITI